FAVERLVDQHRQGVHIGDAAKFTAASKLIDGVIEASQHLRCLRRAAQHEMNVGGKAQRMLFDARSFVAAPGCGGGGNAIGEEAIDDAGQEISQGLSIVGDWNDLDLMSLVCNGSIDAGVRIPEPRTDPEAKPLLPST